MVLNHNFFIPRITNTIHKKATIQISSTTARVDVGQPGSKLKTKNPENILSGSIIQHSRVTGTGPHLPRAVSFQGPKKENSFWKIAIAMKGRVDSNLNSRRTVSEPGPWPSLLATLRNDCILICHLVLLLWNLEFIKLVQTGLWRGMNPSIGNR